MFEPLGKKQAYTTKCDEIQNEETSGEEEGSYNIPNEIVLKLFGYFTLSLVCPPRPR